MTKKLLTVILAAIMLFAMVSCGSRIDPRQEQAAMIILSEHGPVLKEMILTWAREERAPTKDEVDLIMSYWSQDERALYEFIGASKAGANPNQLVKIALDMLGLESLGDIVGSPDIGGGYDPRLEQITLNSTSIIDLDRRASRLENRVTKLEKNNDTMQDDIEYLLERVDGGDDIEEPEQPNPSEYPLVTNLQTLKAFSKAYLGERYNKEASDRTELEAIAVELRDAIIRESGVYWEISWPGKPNARKDILSRVSDHIQFDFFLSWNKGSLKPIDHMMWSNRGLNQKRAR